MRTRRAETIRESPFHGRNISEQKGGTLANRDITCTGASVVLSGQAGIWRASTAMAPMMSAVAVIVRASAMTKRDSLPSCRVMG